jgi:hypothetical protein
LRYKDEVLQELRAENALLIALESRVAALEENARTRMEETNSGNHEAVSLDGIQRWWCRVKGAQTDRTLTALFAT